jgi:PAP2 superfamily protein
MHSALSRAVVFALAITVTALSGFSQELTRQAATESSLPDAPQPSQKEIIFGIPKDILHDQAGIWTSPARIRTRDLVWLAPLAVVTGVSIATDHHTMSSVVSHDPDFNNANLNAANGLTGGLVAIPAGLYGLGLLHNNSHERETGILSGEAVIDAYIVQEGLKLTTWRERPMQDNGRGLFFQGSAGTDSSFPSNHSIIAWSSAAVIASEYPSPWAQLGVYSMATGVSLTRVMGQQHFPTDVLIGSAAGWLIGRYVVRKHRSGVLHKNAY